MSGPSPSTVKMNSAASKVGEIYLQAGTAFTKLGELTAQLQLANDDLGSKWTQEEMEMLQTAVQRFGDDLGKIAETMKNRTTAQIRTALKSKGFAEAGIVIQSQPNTIVSTVGSTQKIAVRKSAQVPITNSMTNMKPSSEVTLNMLNASDGDTEMTNQFDSNTIGSP